MQGHFSTSVSGLLISCDKNFGLVIGRPIYNLRLGGKSNDFEQEPSSFGKTFTLLFIDCSGVLMALSISYLSTSSILVSSLRFVTRLAKNI
jgi:hypothetical protein